MDESIILVVGVGMIGVLVVLTCCMILILGRRRKEDSHTSVPYRVTERILSIIGMFCVVMIFRSPMRNQYLILALLSFSVAGAIEAAHQRNAKARQERERQDKQHGTTGSLAP
jgi:hypothetical protein